MYTSRKPEIIGNALEELKIIEALGICAYDFADYNVHNRHQTRVSRAEKLIVLDAFKSIHRKIFEKKIGNIQSSLFEVSTTKSRAISREYTGVWHVDALFPNDATDKKMILASSNDQLKTEFAIGKCAVSAPRDFDKSSFTEDLINSGQLHIWSDYNAGDLVYAPSTTLHRSPVNTTDTDQTRSFHRTWLLV